MVAAAELILAFQAIPSRVLSPLSSAVIRITQINGGEAMNIIATEIKLCGTIRCLQEEVRHKVIASINQFVTILPQAFSVQGEIKWQKGYPLVKNHPLQE